MSKSLYKNTHGQTQGSSFSKCWQLFLLLCEVLNSGGNVFLADMELWLNFLP